VASGETVQRAGVAYGLCENCGVEDAGSLGRVGSGGQDVLTTWDAYHHRQRLR
jgi:hypothetical protein